MKCAVCENKTNGINKTCSKECLNILRSKNGTRIHLEGKTAGLGIKDSIDKKK